MSTHLICTKQHGRHDWTHNRTHNPQPRKNNLSQKNYRENQQNATKKIYDMHVVGTETLQHVVLEKHRICFPTLSAFTTTIFWSGTPCLAKRGVGNCWKIHRTWTTQPVEQHGYSCAFSSSRIQAGHESPHARCQNDYARIIPHWQMGKDGEIHHALGKMQISGTHWNPKIFIIRDGAHR